MSEAVGSLGEEAAKLLGAAEGWWREHAPTLALHQGPECVICPVCQGLAVLRGSSPEVYEHLSEAVGSLMLAVKAAVESQDWTFTRRRADVPVEHIDVT
jgi:hypothetical protein